MTFLLKHLFFIFKAPFYSYKKFHCYLSFSLQLKSTQRYVNEGAVLCLQEAFFALHFEQTLESTCANLLSDLMSISDDEKLKHTIASFYAQYFFSRKISTGEVASYLLQLFSIYIS